MPMESSIEKGLSVYLKRALDDAVQQGASVVVIEMNTLGGSVDAALEIGRDLRSYQIPIITYVTGTATSAGAYIALNTPMIAMSPGSSIGAAEPRIITGQETDPKYVAFWRSEMEAAADAFGRDPQIAAAMADRSIAIDGIIKEGEILSLSAQRATEMGISDGVFANRNLMLEHYGYEGVTIHSEITIAERLARFITQPYAIPILLTIAFVGIAIEFLVPGFGLPGLVGISALLLFFFGHIVAGFAGYEVLILFVIGVILLSIEFFAPGFGIFGISGVGAIIAAIIIAAHDTTLGITSLFIAFAITIVISVILVRFFGYRGVWNKIILSETQQNESGYIAHQNSNQLLGQTGLAVTPLRPAGTMEIGDTRIDVISQGSFIDRGKTVKIVKIEGTRVIVREIQD
ncbi:NfeD family protein [Desulfuribacillus stibiiarsenatis]|uniref:NfeD family protein n=1 Tax=Desulfuribacillus stibiiarsenatis TaxID=1390249 RepID=UPI003F53B1C8